MNLKELRNKVKNITDYNPEIQSYLDDLDELINDAYNQLYLSKRWNFGRKTKFLNIYPDIKPEIPVGGTVPLPNLNILDGRRACAFSGPVSEFQEDPRIWEGQIIEIQGREYTIEKVTSTSVRTVEPLRCTSDTDDVTWIVKHRFYHLPADTVEILGLSHRDAPIPDIRPLWGKKIGLVARRDEELDLREDYTADFSEAYVLCPPQDIPAGMKWGPEVITQAPTVPSPFPASTYWEFAWAFEVGGIIGPLSEPRIINIGIPEQGTSPVVTLHFQTWDDRPVAADAYNPAADIYQNDFEGMKKVVFYNSNFDNAAGARKGLPCWRQVGSAGALINRDDWLPMTATDEASTVTLTGLWNVHAGAPRYQEWDGQHLRIRPYPRPQGFEKEYPNVSAPVDGSMAALYKRRFRQYELRYQRKPYRLCETTDSPQMPYEFHQLIVYAVLHETFVKGGNAAMAGMYDKKIKDAIKILEKRYIDRADTFWQRGQFGIENMGIVYDYNSLRKLN